MKQILISLLISLIYFKTYPQKKLIVNSSCNYYGKSNSSSVYTFASDDEALSGLKLITDASGLAPNFTILAADVNNAAAAILNGERYILYNQTFMYNIARRINYWASISILAHEIGHHLNGHSLQPGGSRPDIELESDKFSGFILGKLGATLKESQSAINSLVPEFGTTTHPGKSARLAAIANGWYQATRNLSEDQNALSKPEFIGNKNGENIAPTYIKRDTITAEPYNWYKPGSFEVYFNDYLFNKTPWSEYTIANIGRVFVLYFYEYQRYVYINNHESDPLNKRIKLDIYEADQEPSPYCLIKSNNTRPIKFQVLNKGRSMTKEVTSTTTSFDKAWLEIKTKEGFTLRCLKYKFDAAPIGIPLPLYLFSF